MMFISAFLTLLALADNPITNDTNRMFQEVSWQDQDQMSGSPQSREILIRELQNLKIAFHNKDKIAITAFFKFPLVDSALSLSGMDKRLDKEVKENGDMITKEMFQKYFAPIYEYFQMKEFSQLFGYVNPTDLLKKNRVTRNVHHKNAACYHIYEIVVHGAVVTLFYGTNTDESYLNKHPDDEMACAEHSYIWTFIFDGQKLHFKNLMDAD